MGNCVSSKSGQSKIIKSNSLQNLPYEMASQKSGETEVKVTRRPHSSGSFGFKRPQSLKGPVLTALNGGEPATIREKQTSSNMSRPTSGGSRFGFGFHTSLKKSVSKQSTNEDDQRNDGSSKENINIDTKARGVPKSKSASATIGHNEIWEKRTAKTGHTTTMEIPRDIKYIDSSSDSVKEKTKANKKPTFLKVPQKLGSKLKTPIKVKPEKETVGEIPEKSKSVTKNSTQFKDSKKLNKGLSNGSTNIMPKKNGDLIKESDHTLVVDASKVNAPKDSGLRYTGNTVGLRRSLLNMKTGNNESSKGKIDLPAKEKQDSTSKPSSNNEISENKDIHVGQANEITSVPVKTTCNIDHICNALENLSFDEPCGNAKLEKITQSLADEIALVDSLQKRKSDIDIDLRKSALKEPNNDRVRSLSGSETQNIGELPLNGLKCRNRNIPKHENSQDSFIERKFSYPEHRRTTLTSCSSIGSDDLMLDIECGLESDLSRDRFASTGSVGHSRSRLHSTDSRSRDMLHEREKLEPKLSKDLENIRKTDYLSAERELLRKSSLARKKSAEDRKSLVFSETEIATDINRFSGTAEEFAALDDHMQQAVMSDVTSIKLMLFRLKRLMAESDGMHNGYILGTKGSASLEAEALTKENEDLKKKLAKFETVIKGKDEQIKRLETDLEMKSKSLELLRRERNNNTDASNQSKIKYPRECTLSKAATVDIAESGGRVLSSSIKRNELSVECSSISDCAQGDIGMTDAR